jgi:hypothetical protein
MGLRFRKSIKLGPGLRINLSKSGISTSIGKRGASINMRKNGTYANIGVPGTGISFHEKLSGSSAAPRSSRSYSTFEAVSSTDTSICQEKPVTLTPSEWIVGFIGMIIWWGGIIAIGWFLIKWLFL